MVRIFLVTILIAILPGSTLAEPSGNPEPATGIDDPYAVTAGEIITEKREPLNREEVPAHPPDTSRYGGGMGGHFGRYGVSAMERERPDTISRIHTIDVPIPEKLLQMVQPILSPEGMLAYDPGAGLLVLRGTEEKVAKAEEFVSELQEVYAHALKQREERAGTLSDLLLNAEGNRRRDHRMPVQIEALLLVGRKEDRLVGVLSGRDPASLQMEMEMLISELSELVAIENFKKGQTDVFQGDPGRSQWPLEAIEGKRLQIQNELAKLNQLRESARVAPGGGSGHTPAATDETRITLPVEAEKMGLNPEDLEGFGFTSVESIGKTLLQSGLADDDHGFAETKISNFGIEFHFVPGKMEVNLVDEEAGRQMLRTATTPIIDKTMILGSSTTEDDETLMLVVRLSSHAQLVPGQRSEPSRRNRR